MIRTSLLLFSLIVMSASPVLKADSLVAPVGDAARFTPEKPARRGPASVQPDHEDTLTAEKDVSETDEKTEAAWILPEGYEGGGCDNCGGGLRASGLIPLPLKLIQQGK